MEDGNKHTEELFRESIASLKRNKVGLKGILHTPVERSGHQSFNVALRQELDIYASIVLVKSIPGYETRHKNVDLCIIRENTEGEYRFVLSVHCVSPMLTREQWIGTSICQWRCRIAEDHYKSQVGAHCKVCLLFRSCQ